MGTITHFIKRYKLVFIFLLFDLLLLLLHLAFSNVSSFVHLDLEHNLPTVYQSAKLIFVGTIAALVLWQLQIMDKLNKKDIIFYGLFAAGFIFLGLDELGQLHEHIDLFVREVMPQYADYQLDLAESVGYYSSTWVLYYFPILVSAGFYFIFGAKYVLQKLNSAKMLYLLMIVAFMATIIFEFLSNQRQIQPQLYYQIIIFEETIEMLGATAGLVVVLKPFLDNSRLIREKVGKKE